MLDEFLTGQVICNEVFFHPKPRGPEYMNIPVFSKIAHVLLDRFIRTYRFFVVLVNTHHQNILNILEVRKIYMYVKDSWNKYIIFYVLR